MNLLLLFASQATGDGCYRVDGPRFEHIREILHAGEGDELEVGILNGPRGTGTIVRMAEDYAIIAPRDLTKVISTPVIDVICAIPRPKILRKVLYVAAMTGVNSLHLVRTNRTDKSYLLSPLLQPGNFEPFLLDGLSQGRWTQMPIVEIHPLFRPFVEDDLPRINHFAPAPKIVADLITTDRIDQVLPVQFDSVLLALGPEGGWVPFERDLLAAAGFRSFSLGDSILRVEYALASAIAQLDLTSRQRSRS